MHLRRRCFLLLSIFLLSLAFPMASSSPKTIAETVVVESFDSNWMPIEPVSTRSIAIKTVIQHPPCRLLIRSSIHRFEHLNSAWGASFSTSLYLVQLQRNDASIMNGFEDAYDIDVLERQSQAFTSCVYMMHRRLHQFHWMMTFVGWGLMHHTCAQQTMQLEQTLFTSPLRETLHLRT